MIARAKPLLGTIVTIQAQAEATDTLAMAAIGKAFEAIAHVGAVMSAHDPDSDLGRLSRAQAGQVVSLDAHTINVLKASQYWNRVSAGAFNPVKAAQRLASMGTRPGLMPGASVYHGMADLDFVSATQVKIKGPLCIDLGGVAKGYAVDQAIAALTRHGISHAVVNAGGDIRVLGDQGFPVDIRHAGDRLRDRLVQRVRRLRNAALATSVAEHADTEFVRTVSCKDNVWRSATVMARDCMTADALTKWVLQSSLWCPRLKMTLREHQATIWRN